VTINLAEYTRTNKQVSIQVSKVSKMTNVNSQALIMEKLTV